MHLVALVLALATLAMPARDAAADAERHATLRLIGLAPVTFRGAGFASGENVRVMLVRQSKTFVRKVQASPTGAFTARFGWLAIDVCRGSIVVTAAGARGSRATYRRACRPPDPVR